MNGDPYNSVPPSPKQVYGRYECIDTVRFTHQLELCPRYNVPALPRTWALSNLPDGEYVGYYHLPSNTWRFSRVEVQRDALVIFEGFRSYP